MIWKLPVLYVCFFFAFYVSVSLQFSCPLLTPCRSSVMLLAHSSADSSPLSSLLIRSHQTCHPAQRARTHSWELPDPDLSPPLPSWPHTQSATDALDIWVTDKTSGEDRGAQVTRRSSEPLPWYCPSEPLNTTHTSSGHTHTHLHSELACQVSRNWGGRFSALKTSEWLNFEVLLSHNFDQGGSRCLWIHAVL